MKFIKALLTTLPRLEPLPTGSKPQLRSRGRPRPRSMIFDLYGTLLISASGDIDKLNFSADYLLDAARQCALPLPDSLAFFQELIAVYKQCLTLESNRRRGPTCPYPEVDILQFWKEVLRQMIPGKVLTDRQLRHFSMFFEYHTNPCTLMPDCSETLAALRDAGLPLGIVSNAQFYTPVLMEYFLSGRWNERRKNVDGFEPSLCIYSYLEEKAKPDPALFVKLCRRLRRRGIAPEEAVFVGNDMIKDMVPAAACGLQTALYAGDARSLRLREDDPAAAGFRPDYVITGLKQLLRLSQS